jgi:hypothetical protein
VNRHAVTRPSLVVACSAALLIAVGIFALYLRGGEPQLAAYEEVFQTVDALFTAVTSKDSKRLDDCENRLEKFREDERLSETAATVLDRIIDQAHTGDWETAAQRLYDFMLAQKRE